MNRLAIDRDIRPLSEFRSKVAAFIQQVHKTRRPLVITQHGKSAAVVLDVTEYEALLDRAELLEDLKTAEVQLAKGKGVEHADAKKRIIEKLGK